MIRADIGKVIEDQTKRFFSEDTEVDRGIVYGVCSGGKRIRPRLMAAVYRQSGGKFPEELILGMTALEWIHSYSLIHDDLPDMDDDDFRRGKPTVHKAFSPGIAILAGDGLLNGAAELLFSGSEKDVQFGKKLFQKSGIRGMIGGQGTDISPGKLTDDQWETMIRQKTGALFAAAAFGGALYAGCSEEMCQWWEEAGERFGLLFQLADDMEDEKQDEKKGAEFGFRKDFLLQKYAREREKLLVFPEFSNNRELSRMLQRLDEVMG